MDLQLNGRKAIVTGGTKGIGLAIAQTLAREGASVAICSRDAVAAQQTAASLGALRNDDIGGNGVFLGEGVDVADGAALKAWVETVAQQWGGLDIVVANVSALSIANDIASWRKQFETDMLGTVHLVDAAMPYLEASSAASIIAISSVSGREVDFAAGPYGTFKAALVHYIQGLAYQLAPKGIRANTVSPGNVYFEGGVWDWIEKNDPKLYADSLALNPSKRMARPQEIADAVAFMASPVASFISGTNLVVDGALTRGVQL